MLSTIAKRIFGTVNERMIKSIQPIVVEVNALEPELQKLSDSDLRGQTDRFRRKLRSGETLSDILPEAFATVREVSRRTLGLRHFDVQIIGGVILHRGMIAEMRTGEGKTLVATLATYLNALEGKGVHIVTVNDYLAKRDSEWMGKIHEFLGLTVGCIVHDLDDDERRAAYAADVTYGTNNELGFDYLRDNMKFTRAEMVQRPFNFAIVDEVDSILIDEARTPLIISGPSEDNSDLYVKVDWLIPKLEAADFEKDEKARTVTLTEEGSKKIEAMLTAEGIVEPGSNLYDMANIGAVHHANQALRAHKLFTRDVDYIVKDNKLVIIDEFTGRMMEGRRYSEGLHQALEAKEKVPVQNENQTLASITFQNYFRLYKKLAGMTGTAMTEAAEFRDIYKLDVIEIPTNMAVARSDRDDEIYRTLDEKNAAIIALIEECHKKGQPMLVGTISIERSEYLSGLLKKKKIPHQVLNARYHEQEAEIIAQAGRSRGVTIATNMAGRGTDIMLGGNPEPLIKQAPEQKEKIAAEIQADKEKVIAAGGLYVIGTERHESRRIDNQLRGRSGRQGDPGESKFFLSLQDDLMRIFGSEKMDAFLRRMGLKEGEAIFHPWMSKALEKAQSRVEARNYEMRKSLLKFDDVMNDQRKVIYEQRIELMEAEDVSETINEMLREVTENLVNLHVPQNAYAEAWQTETLEKELRRIFGFTIPVEEWAMEEGAAEKEIIERVLHEVRYHFEGKEEKYGASVMRNVEKRLLLFTLDGLWKDHLLSLDHLRQGINLRAYGQKDPLNEYKREAFMMFERMLGNLREVVISRLSHLELSVLPVEKPRIIPAPKRMKMHETRIDPGAPPEMRQQEREVETHVPLKIRHSEVIDPNNPETWGRIGRNEACPCGSGKKYKHCHGTL